jgi:hypothetical protein
MRMGRFTWAALGVLAGAVGCAGNGDGLDQNGQPITPGGGGPTGPITANFQSIQENVFTPICSKCHIGASAPEGLQLDASHSYNSLVGVPSVEDPSLLRVKPSDPDDSYMVHKIEGAPGIVGGQMPLGETPLPQATIQAIRQWITDGATNATGTAASAQILAVESTEPIDKAVVNAPLRHIVVAFTQELDASLINETTVTLDRMQSPSSNSESATAVGMKRMSATAALAELNPAVLLITPAAALAPGVYRATLRGTGGGALANLNAAILGADFSFEFTVESAP